LYLTNSPAHDSGVLTGKGRLGKGCAYATRIEQRLLDFIGGVERADIRRHGDLGFDQ